jgi:hypothetical protein
LRMIAGGMEYDVIDGTLRQPQSIVAINKERELPPFNPGITPVLPSYSLRSVDAAQTLDEVSV